MMDERKLRYLLAGAWNTVFGYAVGLALYSLFHEQLHVVAIGVVANLLAITMSFMSYKLFVFRTRGNWLSEYLRCYLVYGGSALLGVCMLWVLVDGLGLPFWLAQGLIIVLTVTVSYFGHARFTFRRNAVGNPKG
ncbi:GtrA family protein [Uliginosibacterium sediminicola]|uniref:GtrA family protein n=1 Tax=Uliginosibacterium sediminicola TaxID=2024550 RepID=A0ABU9YWV8_9RHOO